jgi:hypothetical protein
LVRPPGFANDHVCSLARTLTERTAVEGKMGVTQLVLADFYIVTNP